MYAGGVSTNNIASWDGSSWSPLGSGINYGVWSLAVYDNKLIAGGCITTAGGVSANNIASWDGFSWSPLGSGMNSYVQGLAVYDNKLIAGGLFTTAGGVSANYIASWDGSSWSPLGSGMWGDDRWVFALTVYDNKLIAGGRFTTAGGVSANNIASWDGSSWSPLESGMNSDVYALAVYDNKLIAGGAFTTAGGMSANYIASWDGSSWSPLGTGMNSTVDALAVYDNKLIAGGVFTTAGGVSANSIASWDGSSWSPLGSGMNYSVDALAVYDNKLIAGGVFTTAGGVSANYIAQWKKPEQDQSLVASIDNIAPNPANLGQLVSFSGHGWDQDGTIIGYNWRSESEQLSTHRVFSTSALPAGEHLIFFKVQGNDGNWSQETCRELKVFDEGAQTIKQQLTLMRDATIAYLQETHNLYVDRSGKAMKRMTEGAQWQNFAITVVSDLLAANAVDILLQAGRYGVIKGAQKALELLIEQLIIQDITLGFAVSVKTFLLNSNMHPEWSENDFITNYRYHLAGSDGVDYGYNIKGFDALISYVTNEFNNQINSVPPSLPPGFPTNEICIHISSMTNFLNQLTPYDLTPKHEASTYYGIAGTCDVGIVPMNPVYGGTTSNAIKNLDVFIAANDAAEAVSTAVTIGCAANTIIKILSFFTGVGGAVYEGVYWPAQSACVVATQVTGYADLATRGMIVPPFLDATEKYISDTKLIRTFCTMILDDIDGALTEGPGIHYACSPLVDVYGMTISCPPGNCNNPTISGTVSVHIPNWSPDKMGKAQMRFEMLNFTNRSIVAARTSDVWDIPPSSDNIYTMTFTGPSPYFVGGTRFIGQGYVSISNGGIICPQVEFDPCASSRSGYSELLSGWLETGAETTIVVTTQASTRKVHFILGFAGTDLDLNVYDESGNHVGYDYGSGQVQLQIPGATYSGNVSNPEVISVPIVGSRQFTVKVSANLTFGPENFNLMMVEDDYHPAQMLAMPLEMRFLAIGVPTTITLPIALLEVGCQISLTGLSCTVDNLINTVGDTIYSSNVAVSIPATTIPPDSSIVCHVSVSFPPACSLGTYTGAIHFQSSSNSIDIPCTLSVESAFHGDANGNGLIELGDIVYLINYLYKNGPAPVPLLSGDANCSGEVELGDVVYLISYLYKGGPPPFCK